jgi:hypothetical protein
MWLGVIYLCLKRGLTQLRMKHCNDLCALAHGSSNTLYRAGPNITNRKDTFSTGFEWSPIFIETRTGQHKSLTVKSNSRSTEPISIWVRAVRFIEDKGALDSHGPIPHAAAG